MLRTVHLALGCSLCLCAAAGASPLTVSYYSGACTGTGTCNIVPSVPPQGFVLTHVLCDQFRNGQNLFVQEVTGLNVVDKALFSIGTGSVTNYHLSSGIPFSGGSGIRTHLDGTGDTDPLRVTLVGYIPGTEASGNVPAVGGIGLGVMLVALLGAGALILRRVRLNA